MKVGQLYEYNRRGKKQQRACEEAEQGGDRGGSAKGGREASVGLPEEVQEQIRAFIRSYNFDRPHQGIGGQRPADRFHDVVGEVSRVESELVGTTAVWVGEGAG